MTGRGFAELPGGAQCTCRVRGAWQGVRPPLVTAPRACRGLGARLCSAGRCAVDRPRGAGFFLAQNEERGARRKRRSSSRDREWLRTRPAARRRSRLGAATRAASKNSAGAQLRFSEERGGVGLVMRCDDAASPAPRFHRFDGRLIVPWRRRKAPLLLVINVHRTLATCSGIEGVRGLRNCLCQETSEAARPSRRVAGGMLPFWAPIGAPCRPSQTK
jgi:hypothetical protein